MGIDIGICLWLRERGRERMKIKERVNCWFFILIYKSIYYIFEYVEFEDKFYCILND